MAAAVKSYTLISVLSTLVSWALAFFLVAQLLSGTFDGRICQTSCVNTVFWISFTVAALGLIFNIGVIFTRKSNWIDILALLALLALSGIYSATILIGVSGI